MKADGRWFVCSSNADSPRLLKVKLLLLLLVLLPAPWTRFWWVGGAGVVRRLSVTPTSSNCSLGYHQHCKLQTNSSQNRFRMVPMNFNRFNLVSGYDSAWIILFYFKEKWHKKYSSINIHFKHCY